MRLDRRSINARLNLLITASSLLIHLGCNASLGGENIDVNSMKTTNSGLKYRDERVGSGKQPRIGDICVVNYSCWICEDGQKGKSIGGTQNRGKPFRYKLGDQRMVKGVQEGLSSMKVGGRRVLLIPPTLGYGERSVGHGVIPRNATLFVDIELVSIDLNH